MYVTIWASPCSEQSKAVTCPPLCPALVVAHPLSRVIGRLVAVWVIVGLQQQHSALSMEALLVTQHHGAVPSSGPVSPPHAGIAPSHVLTK